MFEPTYANQVPVVATLVAARGKEEALRNALTAIIPTVLKEPGCIVYAMHVDRADERRIVMVEAWEDLAALHAHLEAAPFRALEAQLAELLIGPPELTLLQRIG